MFEHKVIHDSFTEHDVQHFHLTCRKRQPFTAEPTSEKEGSIKLEPVDESVEVIEKEGTQGNIESAVIGCSQVARAQ